MGLHVHLAHLYVQLYMYNVPIRKRGFILDACNASGYVILGMHPIMHHDAARSIWVQTKIVVPKCPS